jgi:scyllo-inositol 2-dehydrogenase (NADP+)
LNDPIRVGVVGFGLAGRVFHTAVVNAVSGMKLAAIVQRTGDEAALAYPNATIARSVDELLSDETIRLVVVATPSPSHFEVAQTCLNAGRHVVVDKPFTLTSDEAAQLVRLARKQKTLLAVYHNRRWDGDYQTIRQILAAGTLGRIVTFETHLDRFRPKPRLSVWRENGGPGGGILYDLGPHLLDQVVQLFGIPAMVEADVRIERDDSLADDAFDIRLNYPRLTVFARSTLTARTPGPRYVIHGTAGSFVKFGIDPQEEDTKNGMTYNDPAWGREPEEDWGSLHLDGESPRRIPTEPGDYRRYYENVRDAINGLAPLAVPGEDGWKVMRLVELARESSAQHKSLPVDLFRVP